MHDTPYWSKSIRYSLFRDKNEIPTCAAVYKIAQNHSNLGHFFFIKKLIFVRFPNYAYESFIHSQKRRKVLEKNAYTNNVRNKTHREKNLPNDKRWYLVEREYSFKYNLPPLK